jgi:hypothetical protein
LIYGRTPISEMQIGRNEKCPSCGETPVYPFLSNMSQKKADVLCGRETVQIRSEMLKRLPKEELMKKLSPSSEKWMRMIICCMYNMRRSESSFLTMEEPLFTAQMI